MDHRLVIPALALLSSISCSGSGPREELPIDYVTAGADRAVVEGQAVVLTPEGESPTQAPLTFVWSQVSGPPVRLDVDPDARLLVMTPEVSHGTSATLTFRVEASDGTGWALSDEVSVVVESRDVGVLFADSLSDGVDDLFAFDVATPLATRVNAPLPATAEIGWAYYSLDREWIHYVADIAVGTSGTHTRYAWTGRVTCG